MMQNMRRSGITPTRELRALKCSSACSRNIWQSTPTRELRGPGRFSRGRRLGWQSTPTRELRVYPLTDDIINICLAIHTHARIAGDVSSSYSSGSFWQSTPTRELRGQFVCNCKGCRGLRTCILFRIGFENGENTASPAIQRGNTLRRPCTDGGGTHCLRRA